MSLLEILNLIACGLLEYDFTQHVASDLPTEGKFLDTKSCKSQKILHEVVKWTENNKAKLNPSYDL